MSLNNKEPRNHAGSPDVSREASGQGGFSRDLATVMRELEQFLDADVISDWLITEQYTLGGRNPVQALREGHLAEVLQAVNATEHGAYI
jgi:hypothetical protein